MLSAATPSPTIALAAGLERPAKRWLDAGDGWRLLDIVSSVASWQLARLSTIRTIRLRRHHRDLSARHGQWSGTDALHHRSRRILNERRAVRRVVMLVPLLPVTWAWCTGFRCRPGRSRRGARPV